MINYINIHTHTPTQRLDTVEVVNVSLLTSIGIGEGMWCSVGVHPWDIDDTLSLDLEGALKQFQVLNPAKRVIAIGECGLDRLCETPFELQKEWFIKHIELSCKLNMPLIIHCVKCSSDIIALHKQYSKVYRQLPAWIVHGFNSKITIAQEYAKHGIFFSLSYQVLKNEKKMNQLVSSIPLEYIFLETDMCGCGIAECYDLYSSFVPNHDIYREMKACFNELFSLNIY